MTVGDREAPTNSHPGVQRQRLRIRTITVSFAAAVSSAHNDLETTAVERDALIEVWRAWSLGMLEQYRGEVDALEPAPSDGERKTLLTELDAATEAVRRA